MSYNLQLVSISALSLLTGIYIGQYFVQSSKSSSSKSSKRSRSTRDDPELESTSIDTTSLSSSPTSSLPSNASDTEDSEEEDYQVDSTSLNDIPGETRMALVARTDLKMKKGKIAAQCAHAALGCYKLMISEGSHSQNLTLLKRWEKSGQSKIALQVSSKEDMDLLFAKAISLNINSYIVHDAGRTQVEPGSATVLGLGPAPRIILDQVTGDLKLL